MSWKFKDKPLESSDDNSVTDQTSPPENPGDVPAVEPIVEANVSSKDLLAQISKLEKEIAVLNTDISKIKQQEHQKILAAKINTTKEQEHQNREYRQYAIQRFIEELLPQLQSFEMALNFKTEDKMMNNFLIGFKHIHGGIEGILINNGIKPIIPTIGQEFRSHEHDAVEIQELDANAKPDEAGKVVAVYSKGYQLHHRVLLPAKVKITKQVNLKTDDINLEDKIH